MRTVKKYIILAGITLALLTGCSSRSSDSRPVFAESENLICTTIPYPDLLGITMQLTKNDSLLLLNDFMGDTLVHVFDVKNSRLLTKLIPVGNGPGEMISPLDVHIAKDRLYVAYRQTMTLYSLPPDSLLLPDRKLKKHFQTPTETIHLFPLSDSLFIASGYFQPRYAVFDYRGEKVHEFGDYPAYWSREKDLPLRVRAMFHQTGFAKHPVEARFVAYSSHTLEIYDYGKGIRQPALITGFLMEKYNYSWIDDGTILSTQKGDDVERGIKSVVCTSGCIYIAYSPARNTSDSSGSQIRIIDWEGKPVKILHFDKHIRCLAADEKENKIYLIAEDPDDTLMYFPGSAKAPAQCHQVSDTK